MRLLVALFLSAMVLMTVGGAVHAAGTFGDSCVVDSDCNTGLECPNGLCEAVLGEGPESALGLLKIIENIGQWVFAFFLAVSIIYIVVAAFKFITGGPDDVTEARDKLVYAVIGISLALFAAAFDDILRAIIVN